MVDTPQFPGTGRSVDGGKLTAPNIGPGTVPEILPLPDLADMVNLSNAELQDLLARYGISEHWPGLVAQVQRYNADFASMSTRLDPAAFAAAEARLLDLAPRADGKPSQAMLGLARRTQERYTTLEAIDGNVEQDMIWISEGDDSVCSGCSEHAGEIKSYAEHMADPPGSQQCGPRCRCQLIMID